MSPTNKIITQVNTQEEFVDLKRIFYLILHYWYLILIFSALGVVGAYIYNLYQQKTYQVDAKIIVPKKSNDFNIEGIFTANKMPANMVSLNNEIEILKSFKLNQRVAQTLNWRTSWFKKDLLSWEGIYKNEPFALVENSIDANVENVLIEITPFNSYNYQIAVNGNGVTKNGTVHIDFKANATFGEPFKNDYFDFTLNNIPEHLIKANDLYSFRFNNINDNAIRILNSFSIKAADENSEVITLKFTGNEYYRGIDYLNQLIQVYLDLKLEEKTESQKRSLKFIEDQLSGISDSLFLSESNYSEYRSRNQLINLSSQGEMVLQLIGEIERERNQQQTQLDYFRNLLKYLGKADEIKKIVSPSIVGINDVGFISLVQKLTDLYRNREVLSYTSRENNPQLVMLNNEITQVNQLLNGNLINLIENAEISIKALNKRLQQTNSQLNKLPSKEQKLINIQRQYELTNEIYTYLLQKKAETELAIASAVVDVKIIDSASIEKVVFVGKSPTVILILGGIVGLIFPVFLIIIFNAFDTKVKTKTDVQQITSLPILGSVMHNKKKSETPVSDDPSSVIAESYRTIRTNTKYMFGDEPGNVIGIHSVNSSEGKTFTAVNLATIFALNDKKTLLIGCDLRKPHLSSIFNLTNESGLTTYLIGQNAYHEIIFDTLINHLYIIPSGPIPPNPSELLEKENFKRLIEECSKNFDYVIIDNSPVSLVTDSLITSRMTDLNIFVLRSGRTSKDHLAIINDITINKVLKKPAIIINDISSTNLGYGYGYGYGYGEKSSS